jgi:hypothetical protein
MSSHLKRKFLKKLFFSSNIIKKPQVLKRWSIEERETKSIEKEKKKKKKEKGKEKLQESLQIKGKSIF